MKFAKAVVIDTPIGGPNATVTLLREASKDPDNPLLNEGWTLTDEAYGLLAEKGGRFVLIPWQHVRMCELSEEAATAVVRRRTSKEGALAVGRGTS